MMKTAKTLTTLVLVIIVIMLLSLTIACGCNDDNETPSAEIQKLDVTDLEAIQLNHSENYIQDLMQVIDENEDQYIRERAIFTLTDIAIRENETEQVVDFLKNIASNEEDDNVRTSAYANIDLIRDKYPLEKQGSLELFVTGEIHKGNIITLVARISSAIDLEEIATVGIVSLEKGIDLLSDGVHKIPLEANVPVDIEFDLSLTETGQFVIPVTLKLSFDRIDYEKIQEEIGLIVNESDGELVYPEEQD
ncbi:MAG: hypothetical protein HQ553_04920 [Chloroflexi bacterium]|nr:hypothetical protein [Chloroflexota bacterium]